jgi:hypothetical protein
VVEDVEDGRRRSKAVEGLSAREPGLASTPLGAVAQLGERLDRTQEVRGSSPLSSTVNCELKNAVSGARNCWNRLMVRETGTSTSPPDTGHRTPDTAFSNTTAFRSTNDRTPRDRL